MILVNKTIQVSHEQFYDTSSVCCIVCPTPKVKSSSVTIYLTSFTLYYLLTLLRLVTTILLSVSMRFCLFVYLVCLLLSVLYLIYSSSNYPRGSLTSSFASLCISPLVFEVFPEYSFKLLIPASSHHSLSSISLFCFSFVTTHYLTQ